MGDDSDAHCVDLPEAGYAEWAFLGINSAIILYCVFALRPSQQPSFSLSYCLSHALIFLYATGRLAQCSIRLANIGDTCDLYSHFLWVFPLALEFSAYLLILRFWARIVWFGSCAAHGEQPISHSHSRGHHEDVSGPTSRWAGGMFHSTGWFYFDILSLVAAGVVWVLFICSCVTFGVTRRQDRRYVSGSTNFGISAVNFLSAAAFSYNCIGLRRTVGFYSTITRFQVIRGTANRKVTLVTRVAFLCVICFLVWSVLMAYEGWEIIKSTNFSSKPQVLYFSIEVLPVLSLLYLVKLHSAHSTPHPSPTGITAPLMPNQPSTGSETDSEY